MGCHSLLQGIFPTQGSNLSLQRFRQTLYHLSYQGAPVDSEEGIPKTGWAGGHHQLSCGLQKEPEPQKGPLSQPSLLCTTTPSPAHALWVISDFLSLEKLHRTERRAFSLASRGLPGKAGCMGFRSTFLPPNGHMTLKITFLLILSFLICKMRVIQYLSHRSGKKIKSDDACKCS